VALAIVAGALLIYKYWEPIKAFFKGIWSGVQMDMEPILNLWESFKEAILGVWEAVSSLIDIFVPLKSGQEGVNQAFEAGQVVGLALAWVFKAILAVATYAAKGVEAVVIVVASLIDAVVTLVKSLYHLATGDVKAAGADWSSFSDRFWKRLENSSMNPDKPAKKAEAAAGPARRPRPLGSPAEGSEAVESGAPHAGGPLMAQLAQPQAAAPVALTYSPKVELKGSASADDEARILAILRKHGDEFADMVQQRFDRKLRWNGAH
jgi:hypothetical protein